MLDFPTIFDWLEYFAFLRGFNGAYLLVATAVFIIVPHDWRLSLFALTGQYLVAALLFTDVLDPHLAIVKLLTGLFVCLILYLTARQVNWGRLPVDVSLEEAAQLRQERQIHFGPYLLPISTPARLLLTCLMVLLIAYGAQQPQYQLPVVPAHINLAVFALCGLGLLGFSLTTEPLKAGMGLLTFLIGFELFYNALEQSVAMLVFLSGATLIVTLVIAYLIQARHTFSAIFD